MQKKLETYIELKEISPILASIRHINPYSIAPNYFNNIVENILLQLKSSDVVECSNLNQSLTDVPDGYFDTLPLLILNKLKQQESAIGELETLSPVLAKITNKNPYKAPKKYFEQLPNQLFDNIELLRPKVISLNKQKFSFTKYAVAAAFISILSLGFYSVIKKQNNNIALPAYVFEGEKINNVDEELSKVSNEDIIKYLQANGENIDAQTVALNTTAEELPSQDDYLTDEKALDKYLDNSEPKNLKN